MGQFCNRSRGSLQQESLLPRLHLAAEHDYACMSSLPRYPLAHDLKAYQSRFAKVLRYKLSAYGVSEAVEVINQSLVDSFSVLTEPSTEKPPAFASLLEGLTIANLCLRLAVEMYVAKPNR